MEILNTKSLPKVRDGRLNPFGTVSTAGISIHDAREQVCEEVVTETVTAVESPFDFTTGEFTDEHVRGNMYAWDVEAVPDESRFPKPEAVVHERRDLDYEKVLKTVGSVQDEVSFGLCKEQALEILNQERESKKPRKGVIDCLSSYCEAGDDRLQDWKKLATKPHCCRIVSMSVCYIGCETPHVWIAKDEAEERKLITDFFDLYAAGGIRIGFNTAAYDDRVMFFRALILNIPVPQQLQLNRYGGRQSIDLMAKMFGSLSDAVQLKTLLRHLGIRPPAGDVNGSHVLEMVESGQWGELAMYNASDAWSEARLYERVTRVLDLS